jgi:hypothetical protein
MDGLIISLSLAVSICETGMMIVLHQRVVVLVK